MLTTLLSGQEPWSSGYGGDSRSRGRGFESRHSMDIFFTYIAVEVVVFV